MDFRPFRLGANRIIAVLLLTLVLLSAVDRLAEASGNNKSFESQTTLKLVRSLLRDQHYLEAISLIQTRLETQTAGEPKLPLLLLLADAYMGIGDVTHAETAISQAETQVVKPAEKKAVEKRQQSLARLKLRLPPVPESAVEDTTQEAEITPYQPGGSLVTNSFFETDLRQVLTDLSMETGVPILWDATVQGLVTYEAKGQPLDDVLQAIVLPMGFTYTFKNGTYFIGSAKPEDPAFALLSQTAVVLLSNLDATEAIDLLSDHFEPYVKASKSANLVCITAPPYLIERIRNDLTALDAPPQQILIEVIVTEISGDALRQLGLDWTMVDTVGNAIWNLADSLTNPTGFLGQPRIEGNYSRSGVAVGNYAVDLFATLEALLQTGEAKIRANPRITTMNARTAQIGLKKDQYFIIQTGTSQYYQYNTLQSVSSGITLEITPYASEKGDITLLVKPEVDDVVGATTGDLPVISRRSASTMVRVKDGETLTIGGLSIQQEKNIQRKIPFLGDIPILGYFFRFDSHEMKDSEIIIFVTPHILKD